MQTHTIEARTHGRYLVDCPDSDEPLPMLVGFHGYAETAERMLEQLVRIRGDRRWILVSVQALHPFYNRVNGIAANWMTRQDRELAITDNLAYVTSVVGAVRRDYVVSDVVVYAGFSQGVAMAYRAAAFVAPPGPRGVILLAGDIPPDVAPAVASLPPLLVGRGARDDWYTEPKAAADLEVLATAGITPSVHVFDAGHVWDPSFVVRAGEFLDAIS